MAAKGLKKPLKKGLVLLVLVLAFLVTGLQGPASGSSQPASDSENSASVQVVGGTNWGLDVIIVVPGPNQSDLCVGVSLKSDPTCSAS